MELNYSPKANQIQNLLTEYLSIETNIGTEVKVPQMPVSVSHLNEAKSIQAQIDNAILHNKAIKEQRSRNGFRKNQIEDQIRKLSPMNIWVPYWVNDQIIRVGFETTDWPMHVPRMMLKYEGQELKKLKHRHVRG